MCNGEGVVGSGIVCRMVTVMPCLATGMLLRAVSLGDFSLVRISGTHTNLQQTHSLRHTQAAQFRPGSLVTSLCSVSLHKKRDQIHHKSKDAIKGCAKHEMDEAAAGIVF